LWVISTASIGGRSSKTIAGAWNRFGPTPATGLTRCAQTGSTSRLRPSTCARMLEWPAELSRRCPTRSGGTSRSGTASSAGQRRRALPANIQASSSSPLPGGSTGEWKRSPSK
jgi:hypothetical protein